MGPVTLEVDGVDEDETGRFAENVRWNDVSDYLASVVSGPTVDDGRGAFAVTGTKTK